jgi:hypothetical protein
MTGWSLHKLTYYYRLSHAQKCAKARLSINCETELVGKSKTSEELYQHTKQHTVIKKGLWSLVIVGDSNPNPHLILIMTGHILGHNPRTPIPRHVDLGTTQPEIPRILLIVTTVSVRYFELQIQSQDLKMLVKYQSAGSPGFEQPFRNNTYLTMHHGDLLKIGDCIYQAKRAVAIITQTATTTINKK